MYACSYKKLGLEGYLFPSCLKDAQWYKHGHRPLTSYAPRKRLGTSGGYKLQIELNVGPGKRSEQTTWTLCNKKQSSSKDQLPVNIWRWTALSGGHIQPALTHPRAQMQKQTRAQ